LGLTLNGGKIVAGHTDGPWRVKRDSDGIMVESEDEWPIAKLLNNLPDNAEWVAEVEANAHLIAAAPALLVACKRVLSNHHQPCRCPTCRMCKAAIAGAEGRPA
jgi:hypothetical protein